MTDRFITPEELEVVRWLLAAAATDDVSSLRAESLEGARVVPACPCGCASIDFVSEDETVGGSVVAEAVAAWPDGVRAGVMLWAREERILGIEVHDLDPDASRRPPTANVLRKWEDFTAGTAPKT